MARANAGVVCRSAGQGGMEAFGRQVVEATLGLAGGTLATWTVARGFLVMTLLSILLLWWANRTYRHALA